MRFLRWLQSDEAFFWAIVGPWLLLWAAALVLAVVALVWLALHA